MFYIYITGLYRYISLVFKHESHFEKNSSQKLRKWGNKKSPFNGKIAQNYFQKPFFSKNFRRIFEFSSVFVAVNFRKFLEKAHNITIYISPLYNWNSRLEFPEPKISGSAPNPGWLQIATYNCK